MRRCPLPTLALLILATSASAQVPHDHGTHVSPYAGQMEEREVKALSAEELEGLLEGEGLGFALAAELNGLPGPRHVLDMADALGLTEEQRRGVEASRARMADRARELGARIVEEERHLDRMFAAGHATPEGVRERALRIGGLRGELRATHLEAHLETAALLEAAQVDRYRRLRGYAERDGGAGAAPSDP